MKNTRTSWQQITLGDIYRFSVRKLETWGHALASTIQKTTATIVTHTIEPAWQAIKEFGEPELPPLLPPAKPQLPPAKLQLLPTNPNTRFPKYRNGHHLLPSPSQLPTPIKGYPPFPIPFPFHALPIIPQPTELEPKPDAIPQLHPRLGVPLKLRKSTNKRATKRRIEVWDLLYEANLNGIYTYRGQMKYVKEKTGKSCSFSTIKEFRGVMRESAYQAIC